MILESTEEDLECVKCSECPVVSDTQMQCPDNAIATECTCKSHNPCNLDFCCSYLPSMGIYLARCLNHLILLSSAINEGYLMGVYGVNFNKKLS